MIGKTISHYRVIERIGSGAMGEVYKADDLALQRSVALKFLSAELTQDERFKKRFIREAQAASALDHPNVCTIYEIGETPDGRTFIAMCYYAGKSIRELLREGPLPTRSAIEYALGIADGLDMAHRKGIMHRDIKPANIVVSGDGVAKILDFGLAKLAGRSKVTKTGTSMGTLGYMSPEQVRGETLDHRADIFSLGVLLYEMLAGSSPFTADNEAAVIYKILNMDAAPLAGRPDVPERMCGVLAKSMAKEPGARYQAMSEFRDDLLDILREIAPGRISRFEKLNRPRTRHSARNARYAAAGLVIVAALAAAAINRHAIGFFLGFGGLGEKKGIAVLPLEIASAHPEAAAFGAGIVSDLASRIQKLAAYDENLWVVPPDLIKKQGEFDLSRARGAFGVNAILTGTLEDAPASYTLRMRLLDAGTLDRIAEMQVTAGTSKPWHADLNRRLADLLEVNCDSSTLAATTHSSSLIPEAFNPYIMGLGHLWLEEGEALDSAITAFEVAIARDSSFCDARLGRAQALFLKTAQSNDTLLAEKALKACQHTLALDSTNAEATILLGRMQSSWNRKEAALEQFERAISLRPRDTEAQLLIAWTLVELGRYDKAEGAYRAVIEANPGYWAGYESLGYLYYVMGRYADAVPQFEHVSELAPDHAPTYNYLGALFFILERWDEAIQLFEKSFALGKNYEACANLGTLYYMNERFADAARMYEWALEYDRTDHMLIGNLATTYNWIPEERAQAIPLFEQAIALAGKKLLLQPQDSILLSIVAGYYSVIQPDSAVRYAEAALALDKDNAAVLYRAAMVYERIGARARALVLLGESIEKGYSIKEIAHEREFKDLRKDPRYELLVAKKAPPATG